MDLTFCYHDIVGVITYYKTSTMVSWKHQQQTMGIMTSQRASYDITMAWNVVMSRNIYE